MLAAPMCAKDEPVGYTVQPNLYVVPTAPEILSFERPRDVTGTNEKDTQTVSVNTFP